MGFRKGLLMEIISILAFILAIIGGFKLLHVVIDLLAPHLGGAGNMLPVIAFLIIFIGIIVGVNLLGKILKKILDMTLLGGIDNFAGALLGLLKWSFGISLVLWLANSVEISVSEEMAEGTYVYPIVASIAPEVINKLADYLPFIQDLFQNVQESVSV